MELITENLFSVVEKAALNAKKSIFIISPYIKKGPVKKILSSAINKKLDLKLLTLPPGEEYLTGSTDLKAIILLKNAGFEIKMLPLLHAKIYLIDQKVLFIGSANFTNRGLGIGGDNNKEIMIKKRACQEEVEMILNNFWYNEEVRSIEYFGDIEEKVKMLKDQYSTLINLIEKMREDVPRQIISPHQKLLLLLKENGQINSFSHLKKGYFKHVFNIDEKRVVKITRSKEGATKQQKNFEVFNYQVTKKSATLFKDRKIKALILILEEPHQFVCLPTTFLLNKVYLKSYTGKNGDYQFKIKRNGNKLLLTVKGKRSMREHDIKKYENNLHFKLLR